MAVLAQLGVLFEGTRSQQHVNVDGGQVLRGNYRYKMIFRFRLARASRSQELGRGLSVLMCSVKGEGLWWATAMELSGSGGEGLGMRITPHSRQWDQKSGEVQLQYGSRAGCGVDPWMRCWSVVGHRDRELVISGAIIGVAVLWGSGQAMK